MKKLFILFVMSLFVASASFAQINKNWDGTKPEVYKGSKNFVFMYAPFVSGNLGGAYAGTYSSYNDSLNANVSNLFGIGFQYFVTNEISLAGGVNFGTQSWEPTLSNAVADASATQFGISVDGNYHFKALYGVSPYFGLNVNFGSYSSKANWTPTGGSLSTQETSGNSFGVGLNFGFDWYFVPGLSLGGKYTLGYQANGAPEYTQTSGTTTTWTGPKTSSFGTGVASIMLNVHF